MIDKRKMIATAIECENWLERTKRILYPFSKKLITDEWVSGARAGWSAAIQENSVIEQTKPNVS